MSNSNKKVRLEFYQIPAGEDIIAILGNNGIKEYGVDGKMITTNHYHNLMEIGICRQGCGTILFKHRKCAYSEGTVIVVPENYPHNIINVCKEKSFWEFIYLNPTEFLNEYYEKREVEKFIAKINRNYLKMQKDELKITLFVRELECLMDQIRIQDYGYKNCIKGLILTLLMEIVKINCSEMNEQEYKEVTNFDKFSKLKTALSYVENNYSKEIRVSDIAQAAYVSESYLRKIFAENYEMSPLQYVNFVRIQEACKMLQRRNVNINEAARRVGYDNMSTFIRNFKKIMGKTPKQWVIENQNNKNTSSK